MERLVVNPTLSGDTAALSATVERCQAEIDCVFGVEQLLLDIGKILTEQFPPGLQQVELGVNFFTPQEERVSLVRNHVYPGPRVHHSLTTATSYTGELCPEPPKVRQSIPPDEQSVNRKREGPKGGRANLVNNPT